MELAELSTMLKPFFTQKARKVSGSKTIQSQHCESQFVPGWTEFFMAPFKESRFPLFGISIQAGKRSSRSITRRILRDREAQNNNKLAEVLHLKRESDEKSVHFQALQILHILCFTDVNSESETHFFLVKFLNSSSEYMNQTRQVFEFLIEGALQESISHFSLLIFGPITVEIKLDKPIKFTLLPSRQSRAFPNQITTGFFTAMYYERFIPK